MLPLRWVRVQICFAKKAPRHWPKTFNRMDTMGPTANRNVRPYLTGSPRHILTSSAFFDSTQILVAHWSKFREGQLKPEWVRDPIAEWVRGSKREWVAELQWVALLSIGGWLCAEQAVVVREEGEVGVRCPTVHLR